MKEKNIKEIEKFADVINKIQERGKEENKVLVNNVFSSLIGIIERITANSTREETYATILNDLYHSFLLQQKDIAMALNNIKQSVGDVFEKTKVNESKMDTLLTGIKALQLEIENLKIMLTKMYQLLNSKKSSSSNYSNSENKVSIFEEV